MITGTVAVLLLFAPAIVGAFMGKHSRQTQTCIHERLAQQGVSLHVRTELYRQ